MTIRAPGVTRAYGQATVLQYRGQALVAAAGAAVTPYLAGTATPYPGALYATADATTPLAFPVATGADGVVALWGDAPARLDVVASAPGLGQATVTLDLELPPDAAGLDAYTKTESDARYPLKTAPDPYPGYLTPAEGDARYATLPLPPPVIPPEYLTEAEGAAAYAALGHTHPAPAALTDAWVSFVVDGAGAAVTTGQKGHFVVPAGTILEARLLADQTGSVVIDLWKDTYTNAPPTAADSICPTAKPTLAGALKSQNTTLSGWATALADGDILAVNVDSAATVQRVSVVLKVRKS